jgi:hypothetical protein
VLRDMILLVVYVIYYCDDVSDVKGVMIHLVNAVLLVIMSMSTLCLSCRTPASTGTSRDGCHVLGYGERDIRYKLRFTTSGHMIFMGTFRVEKCIIVILILS